MSYGFPKMPHRCQERLISSDQFDVSGVDPLLDHVIVLKCLKGRGIHRVAILTGHGLEKDKSGLRIV